MADDFTLNRIDKLRYRPTREAEEFLESLRRTLIHGEKFRTARLAIARSVIEPKPPELIARGTDMGGAIEGTHLFGDNTSVWATLIALSSDQRVSTAEDFRAMLEAHWHRGALILQDEFQALGRREVDFAVHLASLAGATVRGTEPSGAGGSALPGRAVKVVVRFGEIGIDLRTNAPVEFALNAPGMSPHIALMGKTRSGKTRTGIAERIAQDANVPLLFIDPKGEFIKDGRFVRKSEWHDQTLADRFSGIEPIDVPAQPVPLDFLALPQDSPDSLIAQAAIAFRDSFKQCIRAKGDVAMDNLRQVVEGLVRDQIVSGLIAGHDTRVSLDRIKDAVREFNNQQGRRKDTVEAKLNELTSLRLFDPRLSPTQFFSRRWAIGLGGAPDEPKRLVMFLVLDALANHLLALEDSATDVEGCRALRFLLVIDEAKEILNYRHGALSNLVRKAAAKGGAVMLLSQSPEDFDQEADDFLSQMGTIGVFASNAMSLRNLRAALGRRVSPEEFSDKELQRGIALVKLFGREPSRVMAWR